VAHSTVTPVPYLEVSVAFDRITEFHMNACRKTEKEAA
jgi:hypothetical protein